MSKQYDEMKHALDEKLAEATQLLKSGGASDRIKVSDLVDDLTSDARSFILGEEQGLEVLLPLIGVHAVPLRNTTTRDMIVQYMRQFIALREKAHGHPVRRRWEGIYAENHIFEEERQASKIDDARFLEWIKTHPYGSYSQYKEMLNAQEEKRKRCNKFEVKMKRIDELVTKLEGATCVGAKVIDYGNDAGWEEYDAPKIRLHFDNGLTISFEEPRIGEST